MVIGPLTGAGLNPARAFGPALVSGELGGFDDFMLVYVLGADHGRAAGGARLLQPRASRPGTKGRGGMEPVG